MGLSLKWDCYQNAEEGVHGQVCKKSDTRKNVFTRGKGAQYPHIPH